MNEDMQSAPVDKSAQFHPNLLSSLYSYRSQWALNLQNMCIFLFTVIASCLRRLVFITMWVWDLFDLCSSFTPNRIVARMFLELVENRSDLEKKIKHKLRRIFSDGFALFKACWPSLPWSSPINYAILKHGEVKGRLFSILYHVPTVLPLMQKAKRARCNVRILTLEECFSHWVSSIFASPCLPRCKNKYLINNNCGLFGWSVWSAFITRPASALNLPFVRQNMQYYITISRVARLCSLCVPSRSERMAAKSMSDLHNRQELTDKSRIIVYTVERAPIQSLNPY